MTRLNIQLTLTLILALAGATPVTAGDWSDWSQSLGAAGPDWRSLTEERGLLGPTNRGDQTAPPVAPPVLVDPPRRSRARSYDWRDLPAQCFDKVETRYGKQPIYEAACLSQIPHLVESLPHACRVRVVTWGATREGYDAPCLRDRGYRTIY